MIQTRYGLLPPDAEAEADIVGVGISELVGVNGILELDNPSNPRSSHPRRI